VGVPFVDEAGEAAVECVGADTKGDIALAAGEGGVLALLSCFAPFACSYRL
jgi:hypothetical protein